MGTKYYIPAILALCVFALAGCLGGQSSADDEYHPGIGTPRLSVSATHSTLFDTIWVGETSEAELTLTNLGNGAATSLSSTTLSVPYSFKGGSFPGTGGTCEDTLHPNDRCTVVVEFRPRRGVTLESTLQFNYYNGDATLRTASYSFRSDAMAAAAATLDTQTFNGTGYKLQEFDGAFGAYGSASYVQDDGKIVIAGSAYADEDSDSDADPEAGDGGVVRLNSDGSLDTSFGSGGFVAVDTGLATENLAGMAVQTDGKIVAAGGVVSNGINNLKFLVTRLNTNGSLDTSFGSGLGYVTTSFGGIEDRATKVAIQPDGKIVAVGLSNQGAMNYNVALARYNADGSLDTSFSGDGKVMETFGGSVEVGTNLAVQSDGKIVVVGYTTAATGDMIVLRYNSNGTLDSEFGGGDGIVIQTFGATDSANALRILSDGKMLVGGRASMAGTGWDFAMMKLNSDGSLDTSFGGGDGIVTTDVGVGGEEWITNLSVDSEGRIIAIGKGGAGVGSFYVFVRYLSDGSLDTDFHTDGIYTVAVGPNGGTPYGLSIQDDDKILAVGTAYDGADAKIGIVRIWP